MGCTGIVDDTDTDEVVTQSVRVLSWNVQGLGSPGTLQYESARDILARLDADVVSLNEIDEFEIGYVESLALELGYSEVFVPGYNPFGSIRNGVISRWPIRSRNAFTAAELSGDEEANDMTRLPIEVIIDPPLVRSDLVVVAQHWKAGSITEDAFRRAVDGARIAQIGERWDPVSDWILVMGDVNAQIDEVPGSPSNFSTIPGGLPSSYRLGEDLLDQLRTDGLANDPFAPTLAQGFTLLDALQADGREATRPSSDKRLDYIFMSQAVRDAEYAGEVYDAKDEHLGGLEKSGNAPSRSASEDASDHLPVLIEFTLTN